jgi:HAD superfamily hydrolase (TIGR01509 family)
MPNQPTAVLWDLDGVIADTGEAHYLAWAQTLPAYNIPFSREIFRRIFGMNNTLAINFLFNQDPDPALLAEIDRIKEENFRRDVRGNVQILPGVLDLLKAFQKAGVRQAIASAAAQANIDALVDEAGIRPYFDAIVSGARFPSKPDPQTFLHAAAAVDVPPERCLVFEDAVTGVQAAHHAGMRCVAVTNTNSAEALKEADLVVDRLDRYPAEVYLRLVGKA